jgi:protein O-mannosyl-transferase
VPLSYLAYLSETAAPFSLSVLYPHSGQASGAALAAAALLLAVSLAAARSAKSFPYFLVGWFWFLGALVPVIGLVQVGWQAHADRYTYLPSIGLAVAIVWAVADLLRRLGAPQWLPALAGAASVGILSILTWRQTGFWKDSVTLYEHGLAVTRSNHVLHINLGIELVRQGKIERGLEHFRQAVSIEPGYWYGSLALGAALVRDGKPAEAVPYLETALHQHPESAEAQSALREAREKLAAAVPADSETRRYEHARALLAAGQPEEAKNELRAALRLSPSFSPAATLLCAMLATSADATASEREEALALARGLCEQSANRDPNALDLLAAAEAQLGRYDEAIATAERAIRLADASGQKKLSRVIADRLAVYKSRRPYRAR